MKINYKNLPQLIQDGLEAFSTETEKEVFLLSSIVTISSVFPTVSGCYSRGQINSNLYGVIIAEAASGKSAMKYAKMLAEPIHDSLLYASSIKASGGKGAASTRQKEMLFLPGNISAAAMINIMQECSGGNLIAETEIDTLTNASSHDYGGFDDMLRKAYEHENISKARAKDNEHIEIKFPRLSVVLTGTHDQFSALLPNVENGSFSRFTILLLDGEDNWKDVSPHFGKPIAELMKPLGEKLFTYYTAAKVKKFQFELNAEQWRILNEVGAKRLKIAKTYGRNGSSIAKRHGIMTYRFAMVLSILRHFEVGKVDDVILCSDLDFEMAINLSEKYFYCSLDAYSQMSKKTSTALLKPRTSQLFEALPDEFKSGKELINIADSLGIKERTARNYLKEMADKKAVVPGNGALAWKKAIKL